MPRSTVLLLALATLSTPAVLFAQDADVAGPGTPNYTQSQSAPIQRDQSQPNAAPYQNGYPQNRPDDASTVNNSQPEQGVLLRYKRNSSVHTVGTDAGRTELRVDHGIANVDVYNPVSRGLVLVDLPGGQVELLKNGLYTFNADTNTVRVMHGEADAFPGAVSGQKPIKVKENHQLSFAGPHIRSTSFDEYQASADLLPIPRSAYTSGYGEPGYGGYGPYGYGPYGYPYFAYGYPFWGYGYGFGFGYGGYYRGGYGYGGGFRGGYGGYGGGGGFHGGGGGGGRR